MKDMGMHNYVADIGFSLKNGSGPKLYHWFEEYDPLWVITYSVNNPLVVCGKIEDRNYSTVTLIGVKLFSINDPGIYYWK